jgi:hypothetical protein
MTEKSSTDYEWLGERSLTWWPAVEKKKCLQPGQRVQVTSPSKTLGGLEGVVIESGDFDDRDCTVKLDMREEPIGFFWQEIGII